jgi:predicted RNA binding protein YcfA (HicA-like mRNA interferase family)
MRCGCDINLSQKEKLYVSIKRNPKGRDYRQLISLLEKYGFVVDKSSGKGSHCPVYHPVFQELRWTLSKRKPMSTFHAKEAIRLVEEVMQREEK